jgi:hypothetical protein
MKTSIHVFLTAIGLALESSAVIVAGASGGGNTTNNTTRAQFESEYGIPLPIYENIIPYSNASGVYLGYNASTRDVYVLSARHITANMTAGSTVMIDGLSYNRQTDGVDGFGHLVGGDLRLVRYRRGDLAVPSLPAIPISTTVPVANTALLVVGYGKNRTEDASADAMVADATSTTVGTGYHWTSNIKRWGTNVIEPEFLDLLESTLPVAGTTGTFSLGPYSTVGYMTDFDAPSAAQWLSSNEAQGSVGDSGGGAFRYDGSQWYLSGIYTSIVTFAGQEADTAAFGNLSLLTSVASYSGSINTALGGVTLVPEPSTPALTAVFVSLSLFGIRRRPRQSFTALPAQESRADRRVY